MKKNQLPAFNYYLILGVDFSFILFNIQISVRFFFQNFVPFSENLNFTADNEWHEISERKRRFGSCLKYVIRTDISEVRANLTSKHFFDLSEAGIMHSEKAVCTTTKVDMMRIDLPTWGHAN